IGDLEHALADRVPVVLDAGALDLVGTHSAPTVITPHARELAMLLDAREIRVSVAEVRTDPAAWAERAAAELGVAVLLKGAVTHVCDPVGNRITVTAPTHWLATAGTGDVLGGVLGALVATHHDVLSTDAESLTSLAATAAWVQGEAAQRASARADGGPVTALDIAAALPSVIGALVGR
ncbi:MAG TPA: NAD(P)H-hydrate dehydratase, partial [Agromyces sp.]